MGGVVTLPELLRHWQRIATLDQAADSKEAMVRLARLYYSIGWYAEFIPESVRVPTPADWGTT